MKWIYGYELIYSVLMFYFQIYQITSSVVDTGSCSYYPGHHRVDCIDPVVNVKAEASPASWGGHQSISETDHQEAHRKWGGGGRIGMVKNILRRCWEKPFYKAFFSLSLVSTERRVEYQNYCN